MKNQAAPKGENRKEGRRTAKPSNGPVNRQSKLTTEAALAAMRDFWLSDVPLPLDHDTHALLAWRKLMGQSARFWRAHPEKHKQIDKLWRFFMKATYGPALTTSPKRLRVAEFFDGWRFFARNEESKNALGELALNADLMGEPGIVLHRYLAVLRPILQALQNEDDQFFSDLAIAIRVKKHRSFVDGVVAEYSLLMIGKPPALTFPELCKIVGWKAADLRKKIRELQNTYGELIAPLKPARRGRPPKE